VAVSPERGESDSGGWNVRRVLLVVALVLVGVAIGTVVAKRLPPREPWRVHAPDGSYPRPKDIWW
jgi:hypothetical protein